MGFSMSSLFGGGDDKKKPRQSLLRKVYNSDQVQTRLTNQPLAPGPTSAGAPEPPQIVPGADQAQAALAGARQRKRAAQGSLLSRPLLKSTTPPAAFTPRALIGR